MEENFKNITQRVSIVDVLAFVIPGMFLILNVCWIDGDMMQDIIFGPVERVFPDNLIMRIVYFGFMSYVIGMLISEASWIIEKFFGYLDDISAVICAGMQPQEDEGAQRRRWDVILSNISNILGVLRRCSVKIPNILVIFSVVFGVCLSLDVGEVTKQTFLLALLLLCLAFGVVCFSRSIGLGSARDEQSPSDTDGHPSNETAPAQVVKSWLGTLIGLVSMGIPTWILWSWNWKAEGLLSFIKSDSIWETVGLLLFIVGGSVWLRRATTQTHDIKSLEQSELFRKAQLFQAYYELFRAFCAVTLILYWRMTASGKFPKVGIFHFLVLEFLSTERMLRFKKLKGDYYNAYDLLRRREPGDDGGNGVG